VFSASGSSPPGGRCLPALSAARIHLALPEPQNSYNQTRDPRKVLTYGHRALFECTEPYQMKIVLTTNSCVMSSPRNA
jgi:hypothetical protein